MKTLKPKGLSALKKKFGLAAAVAASASLALSPAMATAQETQQPVPQETQQPVPEVKITVETNPATPQTSAPATPDTITHAASGYVYNPDRIVRLHGSVNEQSAKQVIAKLYELSMEDPDADIELRIDSGGGSVVHGLAIYDVMQSLPNDIVTVCEGHAQSMAAVLMATGTPGKRFAFPSCKIMFHNLSAGTQGQMADMRIAVDQFEIMNDKLVEVVSRHTGWSEDIVHEFLDRNFYPDTETEAVDMGFIDAIIEPVRNEAAPSQKTEQDLPDGFCEQPGRSHMNICPRP